MAGCTPEEAAPPPEVSIADPTVKRTDLLEPFAEKELAEAPPRAVADVPGLTVATLVEGKGDSVRYGMIARFHYIGSLTSGKVFRNTYEEEPATLRLLAPMVPEGLAIAVDGMKVGERRRVDVPATAAYSDQGDPMQQIPPHAGLLYGIELVEVVRGLKVGTVQEGSGDVLAFGQTGQFEYTGVLKKDGTVFDSTQVGQPRAFPIRVGGLIDGWILGLPGMKVGERRRLDIPAELAYGEAGSGQIGQNEDLIFEIELVSIQS
ncbi:MAG: FKBP-type peptidyl-prolyl cis-trans isomerase [Planctomycetota bacterium]